jgi:small multidrug resistance pump
MGYVFLVGAIVCEVVATLSLRASEGFSKPLYTVLVAVGYIAAFVLLSFALQRDIRLGVAYGIWAAAGVALVAVLSVPLFGESLSAIQGAGLALVIAGVVALETGGAQ